MFIFQGYENRIQKSHSELEYNTRHEINYNLIEKDKGNHCTLIVSIKKNENVDKVTALFPRIFHAEDKPNSWLINSPLKLFGKRSIIDDLIK